MMTRLTPRATRTDRRAHRRETLQKFGALTLTCAAMILAPSLAWAAAGQSSPALPSQDTGAWSSMPEALTLMLFGSVLAIGATLAQRAQTRRTAHAATQSRHPVSHPQHVTPHAQ